MARSKAKDKDARRQAAEASVDCSDAMIAQCSGPCFPTSFNSVTLFLPHNKTQHRIPIV